jgi:2-haloacid dehalogenase
MTLKSPVIVFDFGGVLMDWNPRHLYRKLFSDELAMERFLEEIGFNAWNLEQDRGDRSLAEAVALLARRFPAYRELIQAFHERWEETLPGPIEPTVRILDELKVAGYSLYGLSNWSAETFFWVRHRYPFFDWFQAIVLSGEVKMVKPDPGIYRALLARIGRPAGECLFIDDTAANVSGAEALGFDAILFRSPEQLRDALRARGIGIGGP